MKALYRMLQETYGQYTINTTREEGWKEESGQECILGQTHPTDGSTGRKARSRIVHFENSAKEVKPFIVNDVHTTYELIKEITAHVPINTYVIGMRISNTRTGTRNRIYLDGDIPDDVEDIYINLYLKKHPVC